MDQELSNTNEALTIKKIIDDFIQKRLADKLAKLKETEITKETLNNYLPENWIADAAKRVSQLQLVTHAIKYINPDAKGTNIYLTRSDADNNTGFVSTCTLPKKTKRHDVTGNAASLDVYKFLQLTCENETILDRFLRSDPSLYAALPGNDEQKESWFKAFAGIIKTTSEPVSHELAKQIYFPVGDNEYHIVAPLFPTSLVQIIYQNIQTRFSDSTKTAREAKKKSKPHHEGYSEFRNLAIQKFGGTKPQNISQLNSERGGKIYLLPSIPPQWEMQELKPPLRITSIFNKLFEFRVRHVIKKLKFHLKKNKDSNNREIRDKRADYINQLCDELINLAAKIQQLPSGWSTHTTCKLPDSQKYWLDPGRGIVDKEWLRLKELSNWRDEVSDDFARWLNSKLQTKELAHFGDNEHNHWKKLLNHEFSLLKEIF